tara:strand:- start:13991 stop:14647 length:657 start_codon:yes stop_codon:yes gene_type:complete
MKLAQLNQIDVELIDDVRRSFDRLPHTDHKDGKYRLRRYSVIELRTSFWNAKLEAEITRLPRREFSQSEDVNKHQGGVSRSFEEIEDKVLQSELMKEICLTFKKSSDLLDGQEIEIHQMRVQPLRDTVLTPVSPEGVHQDGFDYIAVIGIDRMNIDGGALMVYDEKDAKPFTVKELQDGEMIILNDKKLWHNAEPIKNITAAEAHGDWFVLCAKNNYE